MNRTGKTVHSVEQLLLQVNNAFVILMAAVALGAVKGYISHCLSESRNVTPHYTAFTVAVVCALYVFTSQI